MTGASVAAPRAVFIFASSQLAGVFFPTIKSVSWRLIKRPNNTNSSSHQVQTIPWGVETNQQASSNISLRNARNRTSLILSSISTKRVQLYMGYYCENNPH